MRGDDRQPDAMFRTCLPSNRTNETHASKTDPDARHDGITLFVVDLKDAEGNPTPATAAGSTTCCCRS